ncbi:tetratricopeptide repeat protein [candidate division KSB1 bacterium]|nr:tetratricopeptide repeat protein [candidate division KSB1 bacterium]
MFLGINILLLFFFFIMLFLCLRLKNYYLLSINALGFLAGLAMIMFEISNKDAKLSSLIILFILLSALIIDFLYSLNNNRIYRLFFPGNEFRNIVMNEGTQDEQIKMIFASRIFETEINLHQDVVPEIRDQVVDFWYQGNIAFLKRSFAKAIENYQSSLEKVPTKIVHLNLSGIYLCLKEDEKAIHQCDQALRINKEFWAAWLNRAVAFSHLQQLEEAMGNLEQAIHFGAPMEEVSLFKGNILQKSGRLTEALNQYDAALKENKNLVAIWFQKGLCHNRLNQPNLAIECFQKVILFTPDDHHAHYHYGNSLYRAGKFEDSIKSYDKALRYAPEYDEACNNKGIALSRLGRYRDAIRCFEKVLKFKPNSPEVWNNLGLALEHAMFYERAIFCYQKFIELASNEMNPRVASAKKRIEALQVILKQSDYSLSFGSDDVVPPEKSDYFIT